MMIYCRRCPHLRNHDRDGMVLICALSGQRCYLDDLPWTTMDGCPLILEGDDVKSIGAENTRSQDG
jgi:hypothetical protein